MSTDHAGKRGDSLSGPTSACGPCRCWRQSHRELRMLWCAGQPKHSLVADILDVKVVAVAAQAGQTKGA